MIEHLIELSAALEGELTPMPEDADDVCSLCRSGRSEVESLWCWSCRVTSGQVGLPAKVIIPISFYAKPSALREYMHDFKEDGVDPVLRAGAREAVAAIAARYYREHADRLAARFGAWDAVVAVPSTKRAGVAALQQVLEEHFGGVFAPFVNVLECGPGEIRALQACEDGFVVTGEVKGRRLLLVDDTFTTGAHVHSAHHALRAAGATVCATLVVCRKINPSPKYGTDLLWERQSARAFRFGELPWWSA